jgi:hypothetical protein
LLVAATSSKIQLHIKETGVAGQDNSSGYERDHFDDWALMNRICMELPVGGRNFDFESHVTKRTVDLYSRENAQHLFVYAKDIAREPIKGFEKHIMTNPQVAQDYRRFKDEWDRKNGGGGTGGLMRTLSMRIGQAVGRRKDKEVQQQQIEPIKLDPFEKARTLVASDPGGPHQFSETKIEMIDYRLRLVEALQALRPGSSIPDDWIDTDGKKQSGAYSIQGDNLVLVREDGNDDRVWSIKRPFDLSKRKSQMQIDKERRADEETAEVERRAAEGIEFKQRLSQKIEQTKLGKAWKTAREGNLVDYLQAHPEGITDTWGSLHKLSEDGSTVIKTTTYGKVTNTPVADFRTTEDQRLVRDAQNNYTTSRGMSM